MTDYPLIVRNRAAWIVRGAMAIFLAFLVVLTWAAIRDAWTDANVPPPWVLILFWACGLGAGAVSLAMEASETRVERPGTMVVTRGPPWRRVRLTLSRAEMRIEKTTNGDGDEYFKLMLVAPPRPLATFQGSARTTVESAQARIEAAMAGR